MFFVTIFGEKGKATYRKEARTVFPQTQNICEQIFDFVEN